jgi:ubiquinone/menaquinone biosynthesis C-methylase UbiE
MTIYTYAPEVNNFNNKGISYIYGDLREVPFNDRWFDDIVCQSTLEHFDMDNSIYGYVEGSKKIFGEKSYDFMKAVVELERVLKNKGLLLITVPFGRYEHHGFFQQFDKEMIKRITSFLQTRGSLNNIYFKYIEQGWHLSNEEECESSYSFNPHTSVGKGNDGAAHCRAICCIRYIKD